MLRTILDKVGTVRAAKACGVTPACVSIWKRNNRLPSRKGSAQKRARTYERKIAKLAGISVAELREQEGAEESAQEKRQA